jgi:UDP-glucuronate decarboxylase
VTGGAGFIGSWICDVLVKQKAQVICVDNFSSGQRENIGHLVGLKNFKLVEHDISQPIFFDEKIDVVMHLASRASPFEFARFPIQILKANTLGTWVALGIAKKHEARLFYASTSEVYGDPDPNHVPTKETYNGNVNPVGPRSCYDEAKRVGEAFITAYRIQHGLDTRIVRIFNTYGSRMRSGDVYGRVVTRFIDQAVNGNPLTVFGDGTQTRSFTYVIDLVEGILKTTYLPEASGEVINLGSKVETCIIDLAKIILELTRSKSKIEFHPLPIDDPKRRCPNIDKAKKLLGWKQKIRLQQGLTRTITWFQKEIV